MRIRVRIRVRIRLGVRCWRAGVQACGPRRGLWLERLGVLLDTLTLARLDVAVHDAYP